MHESLEEFKFGLIGKSEKNPHRLIMGKRMSPIFLHCS